MYLWTRFSNDVAQWGETAQCRVCLVAETECSLLTVCASDRPFSTVRHYEVIWHCGARDASGQKQTRASHALNTQQ